MRSFRPELINRIDRVVVFQPLQREDMRALLRHELGKVLNRRGFQIRPWAVEWDEAAIDFLLEQGFSPELGARPLKRAIERHLLTPLALTIVETEFPEGDQFLFISARNGRIDVAFVDPDEEVESATPEAAPARLEELAVDATGAASEIALLRTEHARLETEIDEWRRQKDANLERTRDPLFWESDERFGILASIEYLDRLEAAKRTADGLIARLGGRRNGSKPRRLVQLLAERLYLLDRACVGLRANEPADAFVRLSLSSGIQDEQGFIDELAEMYLGWAERRGMRGSLLTSTGEERILSLTGLAAFTILKPEAGLHIFEEPDGERSFVRTSVQVSVAAQQPSHDDVPVAERASDALAVVDPVRTVVRRYRLEPSPLVRDSVRGWRTGRYERVLAGDFDLVS
jgi:ATP-dependent Clp protease ATP-binding subunit ClpC